MSNHIYLHQGITDYCCKGSKWWWCLLLALLYFILSLCYKSLFSHG